MPPTGAQSRLSLNTAQLVLTNPPLSAAAISQEKAQAQEKAQEKPSHEEADEKLQHKRTFR